MRTHGQSHSSIQVCGQHEHTRASRAFNHENPHKHMHPEAAKLSRRPLGEQDAPGAVARHHDHGQPGAHRDPMHVGSAVSVPS